MIDKTPTLLERLSDAGLKIDVDTMDPEVPRSLPFTPHDATSNQGIIAVQILDPKNAGLVQDTVKAMPGASAFDILTVLHAKFHKRMIPHLSGRVLAQTSPTFPNDEEKIKTHARAFAKAFEAEGITRDRFAIKIPTTSAGVHAAVELQKEGIQTLGTALFSVPQAVAASQAGMWAISPYYNPPRAHADAAYWCDVEDPLTQHPMSHRMVHIKQAYKDLRAKNVTVPQIKSASFLTGREVLAQLELGADHVTVLPGALDDLMSTSQIPPFTKGNWGKRFRSQLDVPHQVWSEWKLPLPVERSTRLAELAKVDPLGGNKEYQPASIDVDYLDGNALDSYNDRDEFTRLRINDAVASFKAAEDQLLAEIGRIQAELQ